MLRHIVRTEPCRYDSSAALRRPSLIGRRAATAGAPLRERVRAERSRPSSVPIVHNGPWIVGWSLFRQAWHVGSGWRPRVGLSRLMGRIASGRIASGRRRTAVGQRLRREAPAVGPRAARPSGSTSWTTRVVPGGVAMERCGGLGIAGFRDPRVYRGGSAARTSSGGDRSGTGRFGWVESRRPGVACHGRDRPGGRSDPTMTGRGPGAAGDPSDAGPRQAGDRFPRAAPAPADLRRNRVGRRRSSTGSGRTDPVVLARRRRSDRRRRRSTGPTCRS